MLDKLIALIHPFAAIASELKILRELYELDLASRNPPIYRITENPKPTDTEVTYGTEEERGTKSALRRLLTGTTTEDEEEEDVQP